MHGIGYLVFPYVISVFDQYDHHILSAALEQTDNRRLAQLSGESLRDLQGTRKGHLSSARIALYTAERHEDFGPYEGGFELPLIQSYLFDMVADELELWGDPVFRGSLEIR